MNIRSFADVMQRVISKHHRDSRIAAPHRVQGRHEDGALKILRLDGECEERGGICSLPEGHTGEIPCTPPPTLQGTAGVGLATGSANSTISWVEVVEPNHLIPGSSYTLAVTGRGFTATFEVDFLEEELWLYGVLTNRDEINSFITQTDRRWISSTLVEIDVDVDPASPPIAVDAAAGIAYGNVES